MSIITLIKQRLQTEVIDIENISIFAISKRKFTVLLYKF